MENKSHALVAGLFTLLLGMGVLIAAMWFSGETHEKVSYVLESRFPVSGLNVQAPVRLRGVDVGKVESIRFDAADPRLILVGIAVRSGTPLTRGTTAQLGSQGVTGLAFVMLEDDGSKPDPLQPLQPSGEREVRIPVRQAFLDELSGSGKDLLSEVGDVARRVNRLLDDKNQAQLVRTLASLEAATEQFSGLARDLSPAVGGVSALTADARKSLQRADGLMTSMTHLAQQLSEKTGALERAAKSAEQVGASAHAMSSELVAESLPRVHALLEELARNSRSLDRLLIDLNEQPHSLVFGRPEAAPGPGESGFNPQRRSQP